MTNKVWVAVVPDTKHFARDVRASLNRIEKTLELAVHAKVELDDSHARRQLDDLADGRTATLNVDADTGLAAAQVAAVARNRRVSLNVEVSKKSIAAVGTALAALSGGRVLQSTFSKLGSTLGNLDKSVPALAGVGMAVASVGSLALSSVGGIVTMGAALAPLAALAAPLPGLLLAGGAAAGVFAAAMADAGTMLGSLKGGFGALQDSISSSFWTEAKQPILDLVNGVLPSLQSGLTNVASSLGSWSASVAASFQAAFSPEVISGILGPLSTSIDNASAGTGAFASAVATLGTFAAQYLPGIGTMFSNLSTSFSDWINGVVSNGQLAGWVQDGVGVLQQLGSVAGGAIGILGGIASAATAAGSNGLQTFAGALQTISGIVNGPAFQGALTTVFQGAAAGAASLGQALGPIGSLFQTLAPTISGALSGLAGTAGQLVSGIANALNTPIVAEGLQSAISGIMTGVQGLLPALPGLATAFGAVAGVVGQLAATLGPVLGAALAAVAPLITSLGTAITPLIQMLGPILTGVIGALAPIITQLTQAFMPLVQAVMPIVSSLFAALMPVVQNLLAAIQPLIPVIVLVAQVLAATLAPALQIVAPVAQALGIVVQTVFQAIATIIQGVVTVISKLMQGDFAGAFRAGQQVTQQVWGVIQNAIQRASALVQSVVSRMTSYVQGAISNGFGALVGLVGGALSRMNSAVSNGIATAIAFFASLPGKIVSALSSFGSLLVSVGRNLMQGFINGVSGFAGRMISAVTAPIRGAIDAAKGLLGIHSPSRVFRQIGDYVGQGLVQGLKGSASGVATAARSMTNAVLNAFDAQKVTASQRNGLLSTIDRGNGQLQSLARQRTSIASKLNAATKALTTAEKGRDKYQQSVLQSLTKFDVTSATTGGGLVENLQGLVAQTKTFTATMSKLRKAGLDAASYRQFIAKGVAALPLAQDLLAGGKGQIRQVASLQGQLSKASNAFAASAADDLYGAGVNAARGLVKGLQSQQGVIAKQMQGIARSMVKTIRSELGIHSPSRVFAAEVGQWIPKGLALGVDGAAGAYQRSLDDLVGYVPAASLSRVASTPFGSAAAGAAGFPESITLLDADGSILARTRVIASDTVTSSNRARATALQAGSRRR